MMTFKKWGILAITAILGVCTTSCSDNDEPADDATPQSGPSTENLYSVKTIVSHDDIVGDDKQKYDVGMYINFTGNDNRELLKDTPWFENQFKTSDWYFEINGQQYRYGNVMAVSGNTAPISMIGYRTIDKYVIAPTSISYEKLKEGPLTFTYKFVWPSKNISHTLTVYAEYNQNFESEKAAMLQTLGEHETGLVELYKVGYWVDDKLLDSAWKENGLLTIPIEE